MRTTLLALVLVLGSLPATACATASGRTPVPNITLEVVNAPSDRGPLTIWVHPAYQSTSRVRLGDLLPGGQASFVYDAPGAGGYLLRAEPQMQGIGQIVVQFDVESDTQHLVWDLRSNTVRRGTRGAAPLTR